MNWAVVTRAALSRRSGSKPTATCLWAGFIGPVRKKPPETGG
jgi:hypothetical protein